MTRAPYPVVPDNHRLPDPRAVEPGPEQCQGGCTSIVMVRDPETGRVRPRRSGEGRAVCKGCTRTDRDELAKARARKKFHDRDAK